MPKPAHQLTVSPPNLPRRLVRTVAASAPGAWLAARALHHLDRLTLRLTGGRTTAAAIMGGLPLITLATTGAKSGQPRSVPLIGIPDEENIILIASNWGQARHPAWYHNLRAHPEVMVTVNGRSQNGRALPYTARQLEGAERARCWQKAVSTYAGYAAYVRRANNRQIPVILLTPQNFSEQR